MGYMVVNWKREDGRPLIESKTSANQHQPENSSSAVAKRGG
jgi:hypothetical protein